jgi:XTP/dITP diphosphohydrolase
MKLLVATHNPGKIREYQTLLAALPLTITSLAEAGIAQDVAETGATFTANARLKAETYAMLSGLWTWADDSGLEVDALAGRPGVYSARYGGPGLSDRERYEIVLAELAALPAEPRTARFRCVVALARPNGSTQTVAAALEGVIAQQPRGEHGFGYDPIFVPNGYHVTLAELTPAIKHQISHRAQAAALAQKRLQQLLTQPD